MLDRLVAQTVDRLKVFERRVGFLRTSDPVDFVEQRRMHRQSRAVGKKTNPLFRTPVKRLADGGKVLGEVFKRRHRHVLEFVRRHDAGREKARDRAADRGEDRMSRLRVARRLGAPPARERVVGAPAEGARVGTHFFPAVERFGAPEFRAEVRAKLRLDVGQHLGLRHPFKGFEPLGHGRGYALARIERSARRNFALRMRDALRRVDVFVRHRPVVPIVLFGRREGGPVVVGHAREREDFAGIRIVGERCAEVREGLRRRFLAFGRVRRKRRLGHFFGLLGRVRLHLDVLGGLRVGRLLRLFGVRGLPDFFKELRVLKSLRPLGAGRHGAAERNGRRLGDVACVLRDGRLQGFRVDAAHGGGNDLGHCISS